MSIVTSIVKFFGYGCAVKAEHSEIFMSGVRFAQETGLREAQQESITTIEPPKIIGKPRNDIFECANPLIPMRKKLNPWKMPSHD